MLSHKQIERQLVSVIRPYLTLNNAELSTYRLIRANQNNSIPDTGGYSTIQVISSDVIGQGETGNIVFEVGQQFRQNIKLIVRIQTFDDEAILRANKLRTELRGDPLSDAMISEGFSLVDSAPVVDLSAIRDTRFEERTSLEIDLNMFEGDLSQDTEVAPEDLGKAGTPHFFFNTEAITSVVIEQYRDLEDDDPFIITPINIEED